MGDPPKVVERPIEIAAETKGGFGDFGVSQSVVEALAMRNLNGTFPIQALVLRDAIEGRDVLAESRTGSGKTLAYAIPIVERLDRGSAPSALVLVPTRELATQVALEFRGIVDVKRLRVATVYGGVPLPPQAQKASHSDVIIATPGRLLDVVQRRRVRLDRIKICVLDEADRMLDMGFLPDVARILEMLPPQRQTLLFSATLRGEVERLATRFTSEAIRHEILEKRGLLPEAEHRFLHVTGDKVECLVRELAGERGLTLIFSRTRHGADRLAHSLKERGFGAQALHGNMPQSSRERTLARFESGRFDVLVATDVAARGLDLDHITHVVNYDPPADDKAYVHRAGRTARAGRSGDVLTFMRPAEVAAVESIARSVKLHKQFRGAAGGHPRAGRRPPRDAIRRPPRPQRATGAR